ncbi:hypothetical protein KQI88_12175 [Alkaliphilus sp. MSJ-5]|uniref:Phage shock protein B n=1 Tax=Alkaliphilus flagellatus TaxID=2841507 RepID=A0ABS6G3W2_9FIRM|nr:hypothetical protein [Alkaliphilus flagellatus]MBU5677169.1 hypothetical protein [Alkaliphilus flagellatus]
MSFLYSFMSLILIAIALGIPVVITILLLRRFGKAPSSHEDYLLEKIRELEGRIKALEDEMF